MRNRSMIVIEWRQKSLAAMCFLLLTQVALADQLVLVRYTNLWSESPARIADAAGVTYLPEQQHLLIADSEISEYGAAKDPKTGLQIFKGRNLFEVSLDASELFGSWMMVPPESKASEPVGIVWDSEKRLLYICDDDRKRLYCYRFSREAGLERLVASISTNAGKDSFSDPEGLALDPLTREILVVSGTKNERVLRFSIDETNSRLNYVSEFSVAGYASDPEGIAVHPVDQSIFLVSSKAITEFSESGKFVQSLAFKKIAGWSDSYRLPGGATFAPSSDPNDDAQALSLYLTCRGIDNGQFPQRDSLDGGLAELRLIRETVDSSSR